MHHANASYKVLIIYFTKQLLIHASYWRQKAAVRNICSIVTVKCADNHEDMHT